MTYANGQLPDNLRIPVLGSTSTLPVDAGVALTLAVEAFTAATGVSVGINQGYRELGSPSDPWNLSPATQWSVRNAYLYHNGNLAAVPGTSNHGADGTRYSAADLYGPVAEFNTKARTQFTPIARRYGWIPNTVPTEPWHWQWVRTLVTPDALEEMAMANYADQLDRIEAQTKATAKAISDLNADLDALRAGERARGERIMAALKKDYKTTVDMRKAVLAALEAHDG